MWCEISANLGTQPKMLKPFEDLMTKTVTLLDPYPIFMQGNPYFTFQQVCPFGRQNAHPSRNMFLRIADSLCVIHCHRRRLNSQGKHSRNRARTHQPHGFDLLQPDAARWICASITRSLKHNVTVSVSRRVSCLWSINLRNSSKVHFQCLLCFYA